MQWLPAGHTRGVRRVLLPPQKQTRMLLGPRRISAGQCQGLIAGKPDRYVSPCAFMDDSGTKNCCDCRMGDAPATKPCPSVADVNTPSADDSTPWWPTDEPVLPANADGVYVFAESGAALSQVLTTQQNLNNAASSGALCTNLTDSGVSCTGTQVYFNNVGKVAFAPQNTTSTAAAGATTNSSDGLSTGAIVGIVPSPSSCPASGSAPLSAQQVAADVLCTHAGEHAARRGGDGAAEGGRQRAVLPGDAGPRVCRAGAAGGRGGARHAAAAGQQEELRPRHAWHRRGRLSQPATRQP
ncbi:hypothetical protein ABPG75_010514 [Micractinium tetrahymenae]